MCTFMKMGRFPAPDMRRKIAEGLKAIRNGISTDASQHELFTMDVAQEIVANTSKSEVEKAIQIVLERGSH